MLTYLDNAATSWPKPDCVGEAMVRFLRDVGANPGRSGHRRAHEAERLRYAVRERLARLFGLRDPLRIIFALNATAALNLAIHGLLPPGSHAIVSGLEHNGVMRPLQSRVWQGVAFSRMDSDEVGRPDVATLEALVRPETRLIIANHVSNVSGLILPVREIGAVARRRGIPFLVDAAQSAGSLAIDLGRDNIDLLAFTGHKGLLGPPGTGGLAISDDFDVDRLPALMQGGTGSRSEHEVQPDFLPDKYEAGTPNAAGLAGLSAALDFLEERGWARIREHERVLARRLLDGLGRIRGVSIVGPGDAEQQTATVSFHVEGRACSEIAQILDEQFEIMCRPGLHCAPSAHRTLGTFPGGTVRFSAGVFSTVEEVERSVGAVAEIAEGGS